MKKANVALVAFYNIKALGVRYLEAALRRSGYNVTTIFFKDFNSINPQPVTDEEICQLVKIVKKERPVFIGYSVMSSMYLETVDKVIDGIKSACPETSAVCGGTFATMFPEYFLNRGVNFVIRADGEIPICRLADALLNDNAYKELPSLCYMENGRIIINPVGDILNDIDGYGCPSVECENAYYISNGKLTFGDPQLSSPSYEVIASRGCPFSCSYCCCENLRRLYPKDQNYVRSRSVKSVIDELTIVKEKFKRLIFIHFYDEIFPSRAGWIDEFVSEYKAKIGLPFKIWSHPKMIDLDIFRKLVDAGLVEATVGVQSGSEHIRRDIFHRYETQEEIINAAHAIKEAGVCWVNYDFMLQHPFETTDDLKQTYSLVKRLSQPFELQLHGLNFLPGTDIVDMAINQKVVSKEQMDKIISAPMSDQFKVYWNQKTDPESQLWYRMIYCMQYPKLREKIEFYESDPMANQADICDLYEKAKKKSKIKYYIKKVNVTLMRLKML